MVPYWSPYWPVPNEAVNAECSLIGRLGMAVIETTRQAAVTWYTFMRIDWELWNSAQHFGLNVPYVCVHLLCPLVDDLSSYKWYWYQQWRNALLGRMNWQTSFFSSVCANVSISYKMVSNDAQYHSCDHLYTQNQFTLRSTCIFCIMYNMHISY